MAARLWLCTATRMFCTQLMQVSGTSECCHIGQTRTGLHIYVDGCCIAVGDSRAVMCSGGKAIRLTQDHKPDLPAESARIKKNGGQVEFQACWRVVLQGSGVRPKVGLAVSRCLGDQVFKEPNRYHILGSLKAIICWLSQSATDCLVYDELFA